MNKTSKRILAIGLPLAAVAATGTAIAFWTSSGSTSGEAATNTTAAVLTVAQVTAPTNMAPGVAPGGVEVTVTNPGPNSVKLSQVVASVSAVVKAVGAPAGTCTAADYTLSGATMNDGAAELAPGASATFTGATLGFLNDTVRDQNGCKGATVTLSYAAS